MCLRFRFLFSPRMLQLEYLQSTIREKLRLGKHLGFPCELTHEIELIAVEQKEVCKRGSYALLNRQVRIAVREYLMPVRTKKRKCFPRDLQKALDHHHRGQETSIMGKQKGHQRAPHRHGLVEPSRHHCLCRCILLDHRPQNKRRGTLLVCHLDDQAKRSLQSEEKHSSNKPARSRKELRHK